MIKLELQMFGGRGASSGMSIAGRKYGTEYKTLHQSGNVKYIRYNLSMASKILLRHKPKIESMRLLIFKTK